jgi:hypothetical protein
MFFSISLRDSITGGLATSLTSFELESEGSDYPIALMAEILACTSAPEASSKGLAIRIFYDALQESLFIFFPHSPSFN